MLHRGWSDWGRWINKKSIISGDYLQVPHRFHQIKRRRARGASVSCGRAVLRYTNIAIITHQQPKARALSSRAQSYPNLASALHNYGNHSVLTKRDDSGLGRIKAHTCEIAHTLDDRRNERCLRKPGFLVLLGFRKGNVSFWQTS